MATGRMEDATVSHSIGNAAGDEGLVKALGLRSATLFVVGSVIGSGIFLTTGIMAASLPSTTLLLLAWTLGGALALAGGLTFAEMGAMFPRSGGVYVFLREAYSPMVGFLYGWAALLVVLAGGIAAVAVGFGEYLSYFVPALSAAHVLLRVPVPWGEFSINASQVTAVGSLVVLGAINYVGVRSGNLTNVVLTAAKIAGLVALPLLAIVFSRTSPVLLPIVPAELVRPAAAFGVAMIAVLWTYEAWYFVTYAAGEIKDPKRTLPRALIAGILILTGIYLAVNVAYFYALSIDQMRGVTRIAERAAMALVGPGGATFIAATVLVSTLGCNAAAILGGARLMFAMAQDGLFFAATKRIHPTHRTPHVAIVVLTAWSAILALSGTYEQLFTYVMFTSILFQVLGGLALFRLRAREPDRPRPYRTWGYPVVPALFVLGSSAFVVNTLFERPAESLIGLVLLAIGLPVYWHWRRTAQQA